MRGYSILMREYGIPEREDGVLRRRYCKTVHGHDAPTGEYALIAYRYRTTGGDFGVERGEERAVSGAPLSLFWSFVLAGWARGYCKAGYWMHFPRSRAPVVWVVRGCAHGLVLVHEVIEHPAFKRHPFAYQLIAYRLKHLLVVFGIQAELLLPARRDLDYHVTPLVVSLLRSGDDVDVNVLEPLSGAVTAFLKTAGHYRSYKSRHANLHVGFEHVVILGLAYVNYCESLGVGGLLVPILQDIEFLYSSCLCAAAGFTAAKRSALRAWVLSVDAVKQKKQEG